MIRSQHASIFATCPLQKLNYQSPDRCTGTVLFICEALKISTGKVLIQVCYKLNKQLNSLMNIQGVKNKSPNFK